MKLLAAVIIILLYSGCTNNDTSGIRQATAIDEPENLPSRLVEWKAVGFSQATHFVVMGKDFAGDPMSYELVSRTICESLDHCVINFWKEGDEYATEIPFSDGQVRNRVAVYVKNNDENVSRLSFRCGSIKGIPVDGNCFND
ncbi:MAG: hypothetical protein LBV45_00605 [Xanthomonadaceae bacterium]|jgi:hypothetical protein|nr:hypothetical protein [Xanthomonadaceae bacterium]